MQRINSYVSAVCSAVIVCALFELMLPNKKYLRMVKIISGICILYTLLKPLNVLTVADFEAPSIDFDFDSEYIEYEKNAKKAFDSAVYSATSESIKKEIESYASADSDSNAVAEVSISENDVQIHIKGIPDSKKEKIITYVKETFGVMPKFTE